MANLWISPPPVNFKLYENRIYGGVVQICTAVGSKEFNKEFGECTLLLVMKPP